MRKVIKYGIFLLILLTTTAIDSPKVDFKCDEKEFHFQSTPKMIEEINKLDSLEARIDSLLIGKMNK